jgi:hypothetical protein
MLNHPPTVRRFLRMCRDLLRPTLLGGPVALVALACADPVAEPRMPIEHAPDVFAHVMGIVTNGEGVPQAGVFAQTFVYRNDCLQKVFGTVPIGPTNRNGRFRSDVYVPRSPEGVGCVRVWIPAEEAGTESDVEVFVRDVEFVFWDGLNSPKDTVDVTLRY